MADRQRKHVNYFTIDEMMALSVIAEILLKNEGRLNALSEIPISEQFIRDLESANTKLNKKIEEVGE